MKDQKNKPLKKTDPMLAVGGILNGALENLTDAGIKYSLGWDDHGHASIVFDDPGTVTLCPTCGKFSAGSSCKQSKCPSWGVTYASTEVAAESLETIPVMAEELAHNLAIDDIPSVADIAASFLDDDDDG